MITAATVGATFADYSDPKIYMGDKRTTMAIQAALQGHPDVELVEPHPHWSGVYTVVADEEFFQAMPRAVHFYVVHQSGVPDSTSEWWSGAVDVRVFG